MFKFLYDRPWIWIVLFFVCMIGLMIGFVVIAERNAQENVPLNNPVSEQNAQ